jgi:hypothetical protein
MQLEGSKDERTKEPYRPRHIAENSCERPGQNLAKGLGTYAPPIVHEFVRETDEGYMSRLRQLHDFGGRSWKIILWSEVVVLQ